MGHHRKIGMTHAGAVKVRTNFFETAAEKQILTVRERFAFHKQTGNQTDDDAYYCSTEYL